jgi:alkanesulfonate monooxygenase SsuD/methylene tetrahydromethanopterin reductase-like flavin-dependent oxidoreductase (luciferase family)
MSRAMEFGIFEEFAHNPERPESESFARSFEVIEAADQGGIDAVWLAEIHFAPDRSMLASPMTIAAGIAGRTKRIKIGTAVQILPLVNPLRIAEDAATVDQISQGRLIFGVGRSGFPRSYQAYGVSYAESKDRFNEALEVICKAWTEPVFSYEGKYHSFHDVRFSPKPYQKPMPPIRVAATSPDTFPAIGSEGFPIFVGVRQGSFEELKPHIQAYRDAYRAAGHPGEGQVFVRVPMYVADDAEHAVSDPEESMMHFLRRQARQQLESTTMAGITDADRRLANSERLEHITYEDACRDKVVVGTPDVVTDRLKGLQDELGLDGILAELNSGGLIPQDKVLHSLSLLCDEVMPAFR